MAYVRPTEGEAYAWTLRNVTDDHLEAAEAEVIALLRMDVTAANVVRAWEERAVRRAVAFLAAGLYEAEQGGATDEGIPLRVRRVSAGDVTVEAAQGHEGVLVDGQLAAAGTDWGSRARRELAEAGVLAHGRAGHSHHGYPGLPSTIVNDI